MITIDQLFEEDFKPEWMTHKERIRNELRRQKHLIKEQQKLFAALSYQRYTGREIERSYRKAALETRLRIASHCDIRGNYLNP